MKPLHKNNYPELLHFIAEIRIISRHNNEKFNAKLTELIHQKLKNAHFNGQLFDFIEILGKQGIFVNAFTDYGIQSSLGLFPEIYKRIKHKILPPLLPENELSNFIHFLFKGKSDYEWLKKINSENWNLLFNSFNQTILNEKFERVNQQLYNAIVILGHRLTNIGIDKYLVMKFPELDDNNSPFFELNQQIILLETSEKKEIVAQRIFELITHTECIFNTLRDKKDEFGTSLHFTYLLQRAQQHITRLRLLLNLFLKTEHKAADEVEAILVFVKAEFGKNDVRRIISENTNLMASRIISHTSEKGEHYIGFSKIENDKLFKSAMGGGLIVVALVYIKHFIHDLHLSLFFEGFLFGLNYGLGFVLMHLLHFTLATKQPAMTASYIAASLTSDLPGQKKPWIVFKQIIKSQLLTLIGNLVVVLPLCFLIAFAVKFLFDTSVFNFTETKTQLFSNHPFYSLSLLYACITGVFLSLSGIVIGYVDNKVVYSNIKQRIIQHPNWSKKIHPKKLLNIATFVEKNFGAILGNLFLGFCLGMAGNIGKFLGLPFDIRHITISAGNFGISLGSNGNYNINLIITVFFGVILIGLINIASSFLITFILACRAQNLSWKQSFKVLIGI